MGNRGALGAALAGFTVLIAGALLGTVVGNASEAEEFGSEPTEIAAGERREPISPLPHSVGVPQLKTTTPEPVETVDETASIESVYTTPEYVPSEEKTPYVPPPEPEPTPDITVGKNE